MLAKLASSNPAAYQATLDVVVRTLDDPSILGMKGRSMNIFSTHPYEILIVLIVLAVIILAVSAAILLIRFSSDRCWRASSPGACTLEAIKRIRLLRRADGNYAQFVLNADRRVSAEPTGSAIGIDLGLAHIYTDSDGHEKDNPRLLRRSERALVRLHKGVSRKVKGSKNRARARNRLARKYLQVEQQRRDFTLGKRATARVRE